MTISDSAQNPGCAKEFARALESFHHAAGWMRNRQRELAVAREERRGFTMARDPDQQSLQRVRELTTQIEQEWKKVWENRENVKRLSFLPAHPVSGRSPEEWQYAIVHAVGEAALLVGGRYEESPKTELSNEEDAQFREQLDFIDVAKRQAEDLAAAGGGLVRRCNLPAPSKHSDGTAPNSPDARLLGTWRAIQNRYDVELKALASTLDPNSREFESARDDLHRRRITELAKWQSEYERFPNYTCPAELEAWLTDFLDIEDSKTALAEKAVGFDRARLEAVMGLAAKLGIDPPPLPSGKIDRAGGVSILRSLLATMKRQKRAEGMFPGGPEGPAVKSFVQGLEANRPATIFHAGAVQVNMKVEGNVGASVVNTAGPNSTIQTSVEQKVAAQEAARGPKIRPWVKLLALVAAIITLATAVIELLKSILSPASH